jgi:hypothetical protein
VLAVPSWLYTDHSAGESAGALPAQAEASGFYYHHLGQSIQEEIENQAAVFTHDTGYCGQNVYLILLSYIRSYTKRTASSA